MGLVSDPNFDRPTDAPHGDLLTRQRVLETTRLLHTLSAVANNTRLKFRRKFSAYESVEMERLLAPVEVLPRLPVRRIDRGAYRLAKGATKRPVGGYTSTQQRHRPLTAAAAAARETTAGAAWSRSSSSGPPCPNHLVPMSRRHFVALFYTTRVRIRRSRTCQKTTATTTVTHRQSASS